MRVLAFDCSTARGSVAVMEDGRILFDRQFDYPRGRGGEFFLALDDAVRAAGRFDRVAVGVGPGSYNGLRTALAAAEGLKLARNVDLVGVASVRAIAPDCGEFLFVGDARGGAFAFAHVRAGQLVSPITLRSPDDLAAALGAAPDLPIYGPALLSAVPGMKVAVPEAGFLAHLAAAEPPATDTLEPIYLKPAHITQPRR